MNTFHEFCKELGIVELGARPLEKYRAFVLELEIR